MNYTVPAPVTPQFGSVQVQVLNNADNTNLCTVDLGPTANNNIADATIPVPAGCLSPDALNNGTFSLRYQVTHGTCTSTCQNITSQLDGMELLVSYSAPGRLGVGSERPRRRIRSVPGACRHDGDPFWSDGVQFVFGGDSRVYLQSGQVELCDTPSTDAPGDRALRRKKGSAATNGTQAGWRATHGDAVGRPRPLRVRRRCPERAFRRRGRRVGCRSACRPDALSASNGTTATGRFAGAIAGGDATRCRRSTLAGGWTGPALPPAGATVTGVSATGASPGGGLAAARSRSPSSGAAGGGCAITDADRDPGDRAPGLRGTRRSQLPACVNTNLANLSLGLHGVVLVRRTDRLSGDRTRLARRCSTAIELTISYTVAGGPRVR